jgi:hypothetical protein
MQRRSTRCGCGIGFIGPEGHHAAANDGSEFSTAGWPDDYITALDGAVHRGRRPRRALLCERGLAVCSRTGECRCVPLNCGDVSVCIGPCVLVARASISKPRP